MLNISNGILDQYHSPIGPPTKKPTRSPVRTLFMIISFYSEFTNGLMYSLYRLASQPLHMHQQLPSNQQIFPLESQLVKMILHVSNF